jgi:hypothetical protein
VSDHLAETEEEALFIGRKIAANVKFSSFFSSTLQKSIWTYQTSESLFTMLKNSITLFRLTTRRPSM